MQEVAEPALFTKLVHVAPLASVADPAWEACSLVLELPSAGFRLTFSATYQPCSLLERPKVCPNPLQTMNMLLLIILHRGHAMQAVQPDMLPQLLCSPMAHSSIRFAATAFAQVSSFKQIKHIMVISIGALQIAAKAPPYEDLPPDALGLADKTALVRFGVDSSALLLACEPGTAGLAKAVVSQWQFDGESLMHLSSMSGAGLLMPPESGQEQEGSCTSSGCCEEDQKAAQVARLAMQVSLAHILGAQPGVIAQNAMQVKSTA